MHETTPSSTLVSFLNGITSVFGSDLALTGGSGPLTYAQLFDRSTVVAGALLRNGVGKGTRIGLLYGNDPRWVVFWAALSRIGAVCVPLSTVSTSTELARLVGHADLHGLVAQESYRERNFVELIEAARLDGADVPYLRWIALDSESPPAWAHGRAWLEGDGHDPFSARRLVEVASAQIHSDDEAICIYTSGQSGEPKGVCHTHGSVATKIPYLREMLGFDESTRTPATLPFFWVGGLVMALFTTLAAGGTVLCGERDPLYDGKQIGSATITVNPFAHLRVAPSLGMTETFGMYSWGHEFRVDGYPLCSPLDEFQPGFEVRLVDDGGVDVADGNDGQILVRGPSVAARIYKADRAVNYTLDGFYRTGDRGRRDGARIHFLGRASDIIKVSGANVSPTEVELELLALETVEQAHVVGLESSQGQTVLGAAVVLADGAAVSMSLLRDYIASRLSSYKVPVVIVRIRADELPMTPSQKVRKPALAALVASRSGWPLT